MLLVLTLAAAPGCVDRPLIVFANHRDTFVDVHIDGDRVLILRPHTTEGLPYQAAAWTWPRRIELRDYMQGTFSTIYASAGDLALQHWRVDIR